MKKIFLLFAAAVAALSSCVKENGLEPQVNTDGKVTINAVAVDSKTVLDGLNVVWENEDALSVVLAGDVTSVAEFSAESVDGAEAKFVYAGTEALALEDATSAYAVYPASAVSQEGGVVKISHTLPEVQTGVVESGMNLSSAALSVEELVEGQATAQFKNALALLQVVVPAGVSEVSLHTATGAALVGDMTFNVVDGVLSVASAGTKRTVTLSTGSELAEGTHNLLVYPGYAPTLTLTMTATDGAVYESTVQYVTFAAGEARKIDLTKIFNLDSRELYVVLPAGETFEVPVVTTDHYQYEVSCTADWVTYEVPTKGFHKETITFTVAQNTTGADREAEVTISWGDRTKSFTIQQKNIFMDFVSTDENPLEWEENFGVFSSKEDAIAGTNPLKFNNVFTISLSDDPTKGTYKVSGMFAFVDVYSKTVSPDYYAKYENGVFTVFGHTQGFYFQSDIEFNYNESDKVFTMVEPEEFGSRHDISGWQNKKGFIYGTAGIKKDEPETSGDPIAGTWNLTSGLIGTGATNPPSISLNGKEMIISGSDGNYKIEKIGDTDYNLSLTLSDNTLVSTPAYPNAPVLTLVYDSEANTLTQSSDFMDYMSLPLSGLVATKPGGAVEETEDPLVTAVVGTYKESHNGTWPTAGTMEIKKSDDPSKGNIMIVFSFDSSAKFYATVTKDGMYAKIEILDNQTCNMFGPVDGTLTFVSEAGYIYGSLQFAGMQSTIPAYSASKQ